MTKGKLALVLGIAAAFAVGVIAVAAFRSGGSDPPGGEALSNAPDAAAEESVSRSAGSDGVGEGIGVRGEWVLTVLNEDGSVAGTHEFHNDLLLQGQLALALALSADRTVPRDPWALRLNLTNDSFSGPCSPGTVFDFFLPCVSSGDQFYREGAASAANGTTVVLTMETEPFGGSATVTAVESQFVLCGSSSETDAATCKTDTLQPFTRTAVSPVEIVEGQRILTTVTLSFTTAP